MAGNRAPPNVGFSRLRSKAAPVLCERDVGGGRSGYHDGVDRRHEEL